MLSLDVLDRAGPSTPTPKLEPRRRRRCRRSRTATGAKRTWARTRAMVPGSSVMAIFALDILSSYQPAAT